MGREREEGIGVYQVFFVLFFSKTRRAHELGFGGRQFAKARKMKLVNENWEEQGGSRVGWGFGGGWGVGGWGGERDEQKNTPVNARVIPASKLYARGGACSLRTAGGLNFPAVSIKTDTTSLFLPCGSQAAPRMMHKTGRTNLHNFRFRKLRAEACGGEEGGEGPNSHPPTHTLS